MNCVRLWINEQSPITMVEFVVFVMLAGFFFLSYSFWEGGLCSVSWVRPHFYISLYRILGCLFVKMSGKKEYWHVLAYMD